MAPALWPHSRSRQLHFSIKSRELHYVFYVACCRPVNSPISLLEGGWVKDYNC
jgi:hypothetical protein